MDHLLHGITIVGLTLGVLGALYLSYDLLDRHHGLLRRLLQIVTPGLVMALPWLILTLAWFIIGYIIQIFNLLTLERVISYFVYLLAFVSAVFGMVGLLSGLFTEDTKAERSVSISFVNGIKGFFISLIYWFLVLVFLFAIDVHLFQRILLICLVYGVAGGVAGSVWKSFNDDIYSREPEHNIPGDSLNQTTPNEPDAQCISSNPESQKGLGYYLKQYVQNILDVVKISFFIPDQSVVRKNAEGSYVLTAPIVTEQSGRKKASRFWFWLWIGLLLATICALLLTPYTFSLVHALINDPYLTGYLIFAFIFTGLLSFFTARIGIIQGETSRFIFTTVNELPGKQIGAIGVFLTLIGFLVQLIEPLCQFFH